MAFESNNINVSSGITASIMMGESLSGSSVYGNVITGNTIYSASTPLEQVILTQINDAFSGLSNSFFDGYDNAGGTTTTTTNWTSVPLDTQREINADFSHNTVVDSSEVTINTAFKYAVFGRVSLEKSATNNRTQAECRLEIDTGSGFGAVAGTTAEMYLRQVDYGATGTFFSILDLNPGDKLRMTFRRETGSGGIATQAGGSSLIIMKLVGGPRGVRGLPGNLESFTDLYVTGGTYSNIFSGNTTEASFVGDGSNLTGINAFGTISSPNGGDVVADQIGDTLNITGNQIDITNTPGTDTIDFALAGDITLDSVFSTELTGGTIYSGSTNLQNIIESLDTFVTGGTMSTGGTMTLTMKSGDDVQVSDVRFVPIMSTYSASQALGGTYTTLTNMTTSLTDGTYLVTFSGYMDVGTNDFGELAIFIDGTEVGSTDGYTYRRFGTNSNGQGTSSDMSIHTQALITISGIQTVDIRAREDVGNAITFEGGSLIIERKY